MKEWDRFTRECALENIPVEMRAEIQKHIDTFNLGSILDGYQICIETISEKAKKGLFGGGNKNRQVAYTLLTPRWLVWSVAAEKSAIFVMSAQLRDITLEDYAQNPGYKLIQDNGVTVTGALTGQVGMLGQRNVSMFIGLGEEPAAQKFKSLFIRALQDARK